MLLTYHQSFDVCSTTVWRSPSMLALCVIRFLAGSGPICSCNRLASGDANISCTIVYADHPVAPMNAIMRCAANGQFHDNTTPATTLVPSNSTQYHAYSSTSTIIVSNTVPTTYVCFMTFTAPTGGPSFDIGNATFLRNVPDFTATRQGRCIYNGA